MLAVFLFSPGGDIVSCFLLGFNTVMRVILVIGGGAAAVVLVLMAVLAAVGIFAVIFDGVTAMIARRWKRQGHEPRGRLGRIILDSAGRRDGKV